MYLTEKQELVLKFIEKYQLKNGSSPTLREMREHFGVSSDNSILKHLKALQEKKYIKKDDTPRGIKLLDSIKEKFDEVKNVVRVPLLGEIPAGGPVLSEEYILDRFTLGSEFVGKGEGFFMLKVRGDSMENAGIFDGDFVLVSSMKRPKNKDIVVALIDNQNTVKRFIKEGNKVYLKPENKKYKNIYPEEELEVQGVVIGLIRKY